MGELASFAFPACRFNTMKHNIRNFDFRGQNLKKVLVMQPIS